VTRAQVPRGPKVLSCGVSALLWWDSDVYWKVERTYRFTRKYEQAQQNSDCTDDRGCERRNAYEEKTVYSGLDERITGVDAHTEQLASACHDERQ
jgi:hypothetical protein